MELPTTTERVTRHTSEAANERIRQEMERRLWYYLDHPQEISDRLKELDQEWDMERALETNAAALALAGLLLGTVRRKYFLLPAVVAGFLLQHGLQGWCPPVPLFRRLGIRTQHEIERERYALKALRGDFGALGRREAEPCLREDLPDRVLEALAA